ncbi:DUF4167 domain-containing protein [uncultured Brevundimonas sp.]|uniref:DUF4167 domain-containing protein n=1 Tax=uncultured Brevundimonas sp. TaxID=213418 RepID=UPI0030ED369E|tara:strand:- start:9447 stop:10418 length:972 start_codon:yes stop_codon:yes gene_type:complete
MRDFKGMKRQRGRNRKPGGGANNANSSNPNRSWDSQGPENIKVRGNAQTVYERYQQLGRDATAAGDRVLAENYMQHAEHYFRVLRALQPQRSVSEIAARELSNQGYDIDFEDESGAQAAAFLAAQQAADRAAQGESRPERDSGDNDTPAGQGQARDSKDRDGPREPRPPRQRDDRPRDDRPRDDRPRDSQPRDDQPRAEGDDGGPRETRRERWERRRDERNRRFGEGTEGEASTSDAGPAVAPESGSGPDAAAPARAETRARRPRADRSDRPATEAPAEAAPALPGFLTRSTVTAAAPAETAEAPVVKRRAPRKKVEAPAADE